MATAPIIPFVSDSSVTAAIGAALAAYPNLDPRGIGPFPDPYVPDHHSFNTWSGRFQVRTAMAYLAEEWVPGADQEQSYSLKHDAERWGKDNEMAPYISNGAMCIALHDSGIRFG